MSDQTYYPALDEKNIVLVAKLVKHNPDFLSKAPYSAEVKEVFTSSQKKEIPEDGEDQEEVEVPTTKKMMEQITKLYSDLQKFGKDAEKSADKSTFFRLSVGLMKDLLNMKEKVSNLIEHELFVSTVLQAMEEVLDADQRTAFMERIERFTEENKSA